ncbi:hypothetical protein PR048_010436 [Dryococelus australis]|uniref:Uncharacterized protein n=1 Tax=Dryococelus australis TaxID=614101 RepID=A0ABQ9I2Q5_9NEOP|nr:hypothetical protein PR048_010436 [Dryococelus australis]
MDGTPYARDISKKTPVQRSVGTLSGNTTPRQRIPATNWTLIREGQGTDCLSARSDFGFPWFSEITSRESMPSCQKKLSPSLMLKLSTIAEGLGAEDCSRILKSSCRVNLFAKNTNVYVVTIATPATRCAQAKGGQRQPTRRLDQHELHCGRGIFRRLPASWELQHINRRGARCVVEGYEPVNKISLARRRREADAGCEGTDLQLSSGAIVLSATIPTYKNPGVAGPGIERGQSNRSATAAPPNIRELSQLRLERFRETKENRNQDCRTGIQTHLLSYDSQKGIPRTVKSTELKGSDRTNKTTCVIFTRSACSVEVSLDDGGGGVNCSNHAVGGDHSGGGVRSSHHGGGNGGGGVGHGGGNGGAGVGHGSGDHSGSAQVARDGGDYGQYGGESDLHYSCRRRCSLQATHQLVHDGSNVRCSALVRENCVRSETTRGLYRYSSREGSRRISKSAAFSVGGAAVLCTRWVSNLLGCSEAGRKCEAYPRGGGKREIPEKARRPTASSGTIPTCENPVTRPGIEPWGSPWWEASVLIAQPP